MQVRLTAVKSVLGSGAVVDSVRFLTNSIFGLCVSERQTPHSRAAVAKSSGSGIIPVYRLSLADHRASVVASLSWHEQPEFFIKMGVWTGPLGARMIGDVRALNTACRAVPHCGQRQPGAAARL